MPKNRNPTKSASPGAKSPGSRDYPVGKGKPPVHTRYPKGVSGNPKGRPSGRRKPDPTFDDILKERISVTGPDGRRRSMSRREVIYRRLANKAVEGDHRAIMAVRDHDARLAAGEVNPDPLNFDPKLAASILTDYEQEVLGRAAKAKRVKRKKR